MTRRIRGGFVTALFISGLVGFAFMPVANAIDANGIGALPANPSPSNPRTKSIFVYDLSPGDNATDGIKVINNTTTKKTISVYPVDSVPSSDGAFACAQAADPIKSVGNWIKLAQSSVTLDAFGSQVIPFTVTVPSKVDVGEHDGCIVIQEDKATTQPAKGGVTLSFRSALRVAVTVPGKLVADLHLQRVSQQAGRNNNYIVTPVYKNTGNISLDTTINAKFVGLFSGTHAAGGKFPILRDSTGTFNFEVKKPFWGGIYKRVVTTSYKPLSSDIKGAPAPKSLPNDESVVLLSPQSAGLVIELAIVAVVAGAVGFFLSRRRTHQMILSNNSTYTIKKGDNIQDIAGRYEMKWKQLARVNGLRAPYTLEKGQKLHVPAKPKISKDKASE
jgi:hypothetical protein